MKKIIIHSVLITSLIALSSTALIAQENSSSENDKRKENYI